MDSVSFTTGEFKQEKTSAWLVAFIQFAQKLGALDVLGQVKIKMKEIEYTVHQKLITLLLSVVIGCRYTSDINHKLVHDKFAAQMMGMSRFPDQSQINELLRRADHNSVEQLKDVHQQLFMQNAGCLSTTGYTTADIDQSGLIANGKKYELASKGYFCKKKNQRGYQLSAAFCGGENSETLSVYLDPENSHCSTRFDDLLHDVLVKLKDVVKERRLILRIDSGYGSDENIQKIRYKVLFVAKAYSTVRASNIAKSIRKEDWEEIDDCDLRTTSFDGIHAFIWVVFIAHNLISWMKSTVFYESKLEDAGTKTLVEKLGTIVGEVRRTAQKIEIILPEISALARKFVESMQPKYEQLSLFSTS